MKLHYAEVLNPRKVCAVAKLLEAPIDYVRVDLAKGEHRSPAFRSEKNPNARIPVLEDGDRVIWESDAILVHLARKLGSDIWPQDDRQVDVVRWLAWNHTHFQPQGGILYFENVIKAKFGAGPPIAEKVEAAQKQFRIFARVLDTHLDGRTALVGDTLTIADFSVGCVMPYREQAQLPLDKFPNILAWAERLEALPAWRDPFPARSH